MGFLIFDTDKQSTQSLRVQLSAMGDRPVRELMDWNAFESLKSKKIPPPEVIFMDQDGDPERVDGFRHQLDAYQGSSVVVLIGTAKQARHAQRFDTYLQKPVFLRKLEGAVAESYARGQHRRPIVGYIGDFVPSGLVREVGRSKLLWKQLVKIDSASVDPKSLANVGAVFVTAENLTPADLELIARMYKFTSAARITIVGVGKTPEETHTLRSRADYFVDHDGDWESVLESIARSRLNKFRSELHLARAKVLIESKSRIRAWLVLRKLLRMDPWNLSARTAYAELLFAAGKLREAASSYHRILKLNPCQPRPYLRLMEIERRIHGKPSEETLARARLYCPNLKELQEKA